MLSKLKIIELAGVLAGPSVGMFFAELGAQVVKVENLRTGGDITRSWRLPSEDPAVEVSAYYCAANWGKQVVFADLQQTADRQYIYTLLADADVVIVNFKQGDDLKLGMDYNTLAALNPRLIYAEITAFGEAQAHRTAYDVVLQAESGLLYMTGEPNRPPAKMPVAMIDLLAAHQLKEGILLALWQRDQTQQGCRVSVSLIDAAIASLANQATNWLMAGHIPQRIGTEHPNIAPYGDMFVCAEQQYIVLAAGSDRQFAHLCQVLGLPDLATNPLFAHNTARVANRLALQQHLSPAFAQRRRDEVLAQLHALQVPAGAIRTLPEVFELPEAQAAILTETTPQGKLTQRVRTVAFQINP